MDTHSPSAHDGLSRRTFIQTAAAAAGMGTLAGAAEPEKPAAKGKMKVGCLSWCFHTFDGGADPSPGIDIIGEMGFDGVELILLDRHDIEGFWTDKKIAQIKDQLQKHKLEVSQFVLFQPVVEGLSSLDETTRRANLEFFEAGCRIGEKLNAPIVNIVAPWPRELGEGQGYIPRFYEISNPKPGETFHLNLAHGFDWDRIWQRFVGTVKDCLAIARRHNMRFTIEHHTHCVIQDASSFLRLCDAIPDPALGYNLDTGWTLAQREYPPVAIHKIGKRLMNLHVRDIDGLMHKFPPIGTGVMDFKAVVDTCKEIGFTGYLSIEQDKYPEDMQEVCRRYLKMMREHIG